MSADNDKSSADTRDRLLDAACEVFADKGFRDSTVKEICQQADANIAAVNYYFGSKEDLYAEAWRRAFERSVAAHPPDGGVEDDAPAHERLRGRIHALIRQMTDEDNQAFRIAHREMAEPTGLLRKVKKECIGPIRRDMSELVAELLGPEASDKQINFTQASIIAQCLCVVQHARRKGNCGCGKMPAHLREIEKNPEAYAEHVFSFSLAGINRETVRKEKTDSEEETQATWREGAN